MVTKAWYVAL
jgi:hypothetical protein